MLRALVVFSFGVLGWISGCEPSGPLDAGSDTPVDAFVRTDTPRDSGPPCDLSCLVAEACCVVDEVPMCVNVVSDVHNCGSCGLDCIATRRGDACLTRQCACGAFDIGCTGITDECCPAVPGGREAHCANVNIAFEDCGACGAACRDGEASECRNGDCMCGVSDRACAGTPGDLCCGLGFGMLAYGCVNTLIDPDHCGACNERCRSDQRCEAGTCVGTYDAGVDAGSDAGSEPDAGTDAGSEADAGEPDAG